MLVFLAYKALHNPKSYLKGAWKSPVHFGDSASSPSSVSTAINSDLSHIVFLCDSRKLLSCLCFWRCIFINVCFWVCVHTHACVCAESNTGHRSPPPSPLSTSLRQDLFIYPGCWGLNPCHHYCAASALSHCAVSPLSPFIWDRASYILSQPQTHHDVEDDSFWSSASPSWVLGLWAYTIPARLCGAGGARQALHQWGESGQCC